MEKEDSEKEQLGVVLKAKAKHGISETDLFRILSTRRSTRNFDSSKTIEQWQIDKILAAADTAPTVGNFQGFEVFYFKNKEIKRRLVEAANNQLYVNAPVVLVFCMGPARIKMNFRPEILAKFSLQDTTLAAAYSQLAASALGLSSIWIGMINEEKVMQILQTELRPTSILCVGYPQKKSSSKIKAEVKGLGSSHRINSPIFVFDIITPGKIFWMIFAMHPRDVFTPSVFSGSVPGYNLMVVFSSFANISIRNC